MKAIHFEFPATLSFEDEHISTIVLGEEVRSWDGRSPSLSHDTNKRKRKLLGDFGLGRREKRRWREMREKQIEEEEGNDDGDTSVDDSQAGNEKKSKKKIQWVKVRS